MTITWTGRIVEGVDSEGGIGRWFYFNGEKVKSPRGGCKWTFEWILKSHYGRVIKLRGRLRGRREEKIHVILTTISVVG